jgi:hypothetical protein
VELNKGDGGGILGSLDHRVIVIHLDSCVAADSAQSSHLDYRQASLLDYRTWSALI